MRLNDLGRHRFVHSRQDIRGWRLGNPRQPLRFGKDRASGGKLDRIYRLQGQRAISRRSYGESGDDLEKLAAPARATSHSEQNSYLSVVSHLDSPAELAAYVHDGPAEGKK